MLTNTKPTSNMRAFRVSASSWLTTTMSNFKRNAMQFTRTLFALLLLLTLTFSCTKQDINEDEKLINDTEVFATDPENDTTENNPIGD